MPKKKEMPPVMILCGGQGTRLREVTEMLPKPMVPVGEQPILWHIMHCYAAFGVRRFILCLGYKKEVFIDYFMNYHLRTTDATVKLGHDPEIRFHGDVEESDWEVTLAGTGIDAMTGARVFRAAKYLKEDDENFFLTYGDGLADVDIGKLYAFHLRGKKLLTVSAVHPEGRFGEIIIRKDEGVGFQEKPSVSQGYVNGGFMVVNRAVVGKYLKDKDPLVFEYEPMKSIAKDHELQVFRHEGFWQCMDNPREYAKLNLLWKSGKAPWTRFWKK